MITKARNAINREGTVYGNLTVIGPREIRGTNTYWNCKCICGVEKFIYAGSLSSGRTTSCGCERGLAPNRYKIKNPLGFSTLKNIKARCYNKANPDYGYYGARGIKVCTEWLANSYSFYKWFDDHYEDGKTLDRQNNNDDYSPDNCKFSTSSEQSLNRRLWTKGETLKL